MRPIDADRLQVILEKNFGHTGGASVLEQLIDEQPTVQPKGHWVFVHPLQEDDTGAYMCSECKVGKWEIDPKSYFFCPNCGADMMKNEEVSK